MPKSTGPVRLFGLCRNTRDTHAAIAPSDAYRVAVRRPSERYSFAIVIVRVAHLVWRRSLCTRGKMTLSALLHAQPKTDRITVQFSHSTGVTCKTFMGLEATCLYTCGYHADMDGRTFRMPELPEAEDNKQSVVIGRGSTLSQAEYEKLKFYFQFCPLALSTGSENRVYESVSVNNTCTGSEARLELPSWVEKQRVARFSLWPPPAWVDRGTNQPWRYLLNQTSLGKLICCRRGKLIVIAAGKSWARGPCFRDAPELFWEIISNDVPGPNEDPDKSELIRTYRIPDRTPRTIKIFGAFVSEKWVHVISDFSGLVRLHVKSCNVIYAPEDFSVGSPEWLYMFESFKGGPDWCLEHSLAQNALRSWRAAVLQEYRLYEKRRDKIKQDNDDKETPTAKNMSKRYDRPIDDYFSARKIGWASVNFGEQKQVELQPIPIPRARPIIKEIATNSLGAFSGFGTPSYVICSDDKEFQRLEDSIYEYLSHFTTDEFLRKISMATNTDNPFAFNETSNDVYMRTEMHVFRRTWVNVPVELYDDYSRRGLLDPEHVIEKAKNYRQVKVLFYGDKLKAYSIVRAQCPEEWGQMPESIEVTKDVKSFGYRTTVGPAQFHEQILNRIVNPPPAKVGRPKT
ncbi:hypothetical protein BJ912DRAFT_927583, partial [Pholiota molesta]